MIAYTPKPKTCAMCPREFLPRASFATCCSPVCARKKVEADKKAKAAAIRQRKDAIQTIPELIYLAQRAFNDYIRERDKDKPCICCGQPLRNGASGSTGGDFDCGHYRSTGSASHLRFTESNAAGQRKVCNRYGAGRAVDYRLGLIARIGLEAVEALEADNTPHKWERDELRAIRATYKAKLKTLKDQAA